MVLVSGPETPMTLPLRVRPLSVEDGMEIATWSYPGPWAAYDATAAPRADEGFWAVEDADARLVGFCCFGVEARVPGLPERPGTLDVGLGMRPELTGLGYGAALGSVVVARAREIAPGERLRCTIQDWNRRSLRVAAAAGFMQVGAHVVDPDPGGVRYVVLEQ